MESWAVERLGGGEVGKVEGEGETVTGVAVAWADSQAVRVSANRSKNMLSWRS